MDSKRSNANTLPRIPNYANNDKQDMIRYDDNKYSDRYGLTYLYNNEFKMKEMNEYLYKIRNELNSDQITIIPHNNLTKKVATGSIPVQPSSTYNVSSSSSSQFYKGYPDYVPTTAKFPLLYEETHENIEENLLNKSYANQGSNTGSGYNSGSIYSRFSHIGYNRYLGTDSINRNSLSHDEGSNFSRRNKKKKIKTFQFDDDSSKSSTFTYSDYIYDEDEFDNGLSYYDNQNNNNANKAHSLNATASTPLIMIDKNDYSSNVYDNNDDVKSIHSMNSSNSFHIDSNNNNKDNNDNNSNNNINYTNGSTSNLKTNDETIYKNSSMDIPIITEPAIRPPGHYQFDLKIRPFEVQQKKLHTYGHNLIRCNRALLRRDMKLRQERYEKEYQDMQSRLSEEAEDSQKRVSYSKQKSLL